jgi:hypothetical protein
VPVVPVDAKIPHVRETTGDFLPEWWGVVLMRASTRQCGIEKRGDIGPASKAEDV